ncbi:hypothetical protein GCM10007938_12370 [Vibrio zhanjiangensis]|uniref:Uncharacterized protein n=1 Tax=Vibrio zhanjiangensis TaxID=1046128 RepID=A0ABQ6EXZ7_9VIBR|nr:hypothetical protein [Vibrio zhanjiangensis]GLT17460.1 hypothetical protein GCM10007938_12370 [Vibrio zhanjiangensis]
MLSRVNSSNNPAQSEAASISASSTFQPVNRQDIEAKHFVDLTCMDNNHGLKMMASIKGGRLVLISGKNKGLLRKIRHSVSSKSNYFQLQLATPSNVKNFTELWVGNDGKLHACYTTPTSGADQYHGIVDISGGFTSDMKVESIQERYKVTVKIAADDVTHSKSLPDSTVILKGGVTANVVWSENERQYRVECNEHSALLNLKGLELFSGKPFEHIKSCGSHLQVTLKDDHNKEKIRYLDVTHLTLSGDSCSLTPVVSDKPPAGFAHFNINNSGHFSNANPFVGRKLRHIGNQYIPLSGWIDGMKHRYSSGKQKEAQGRKDEAWLSYLKMADPGIQTAGRWVKERVSHHKPSPSLMSHQSNINSELASLRRFQSEWNWEVEHQSLATSSEKTDFRLREVLKREAFSKIETEGDIEPLDQVVEKRLSKQFEVCLTILNKLNSGFQSEHGTYQEKLKERFTTIQKRITYITDHPNFGDMPSQKELVQLRELLDILIKAKSTPLKEKDLDLYLPFIERTVANARLYLATVAKHNSNNIKTDIASSQKPKILLAHKLDIENQGHLYQAVTQSIASLKSAKKITKAKVRLGESMMDTRRGIGKIWHKWVGQSFPAEQITQQLATRVSALQKGYSLTLTAEHGVSGFAGIAHFGLPYPLGQGWFAGVVANYEKHYDCKLVALDSGKTQVQFVRKREKGATVMAGTGAGLEDLTKLVKYQHGSLVTIMPFEATLALTAMKDSEQSFAFDVDNGNLEETLGYMFGTRDFSKGLDEQLEKTQFTDREKQKVQFGVSANSEFRLQLGIDVSPHFSVVAPRTYAKAGISIAISREDVREIKFGEENSALKRQDIEKGVDVELSSGANVMLFPLPAPYALPTAIDEKTFISVKPLGDAFKAVHTKKHQTTDTMQDLLQKKVGEDLPSHEVTALENVVSGYTSLIEKASWHPDVRSLALTQLELLLSAADKGGHEVTKAIAAENIPDLKIHYDEKIQWRSRWADNMRRAFHMTPKHSTSFKQMMAPYAGGARLLRELRASAQSQSQMLNINKSSRVTAMAKYRMPMSTLLSQYQQTLERLEVVHDSKETLKILQSLNQQLNRKGEEARSLYQLDTIECARESSLSRQPAGILPMVQIKQKSQVTLKELLGEINFIHNDDNILVKNNLDASILSVFE